MSQKNQSEACYNKTNPLITNLQESILATTPHPSNTWNTTMKGICHHLTRF